MSNTISSAFTSNGATTVAVEEDGTVLLRSSVTKEAGDLTQLRGQTPIALTAEQARDLAKALTDASNGTPKTKGKGE